MQWPLIAIAPQYWFVFALSVTKTMSKLPVQGDSIEISSQPEPPSARDVPLPAGGGLSAHILPTSATMIGVCMTVLTIGHIGSPGDVRWLIDKLLVYPANMQKNLDRLAKLDIGMIAPSHGPVYACVPAAGHWSCVPNGYSSSRWRCSR